MATLADSRAVKSLNNSLGANKFTFKKVREQMKDIKAEVLNVFKSLEKVKAEPSQGSTFLKDALVEWRVLNTAEHFTEFYEEMLPFVQTLPLVISQKEIIFSKLVSKLRMEARFSLEAFLGLIAALSRDLLDSFMPFLPRLVSSLVTLLNLKDGDQKVPEIVKQIFVSWSSIVMNLQKYLICDIKGVLRDTLELRYHPEESINELMSLSMARLLRTARDKQLQIGIKMILCEVADPLNKCGGVNLLYHVMIRDASEKSLHSKAEQVLRFLLKESTLSSCDNCPQRSGSRVEAVSLALQRICKETKAEELTVMWNCLYEETKESIKNKNSAHLTRLLILLTSAVSVGKGHKVPDYTYLVGLVSQILASFMDSSDVLDKVLGLMLCTIDITSDVNEIESIASQWTPIFSLKSLSLVSFLRGLLEKKDKRIVQAFTSNILSWINNMITESSEEEVIPLLLPLCKKQQTSHDKVDIVYGSFESIQEFLEDKIKKIQTNIENKGLAQIDETELAAVWGAVNCFPYFKVDSSLLIRFKNTLKQQLADSVVNASSAQELTWQSLLGATLRSCLKVCSTGRLIYSDVEEALSLAKCYKSCVQVLSPVADYLDFVYRPLLANYGNSKPCPELQANNAEDIFNIFSDNLRHPNKDIRLMTLRILCHFETLSPDPSVEDLPPMKKMKTEVVVQKSSSEENVLQLLKKAEEFNHTLSTGKDLGTIKRVLSDGSIHDAYVPLVFNGMIGLFHRNKSNNESTVIWGPASECLAVLLKKHTGAVWNDFVHYLDQYQLKFGPLYNHSENENYTISQKHTGLMESFHSFIFPPFNGTPAADVVSLLLKTLQKVPNVAQSHASDILPLLLKFMGYNTENPLRVGLYNSEACKGVAWKGLLKQWLTLLKLMKNPRSSCFSQFVNDILQYRFLDDNDAEIQMSVLECLVLWNDYLLPHRHRLENLIKPKELREELTTCWNFSKDIEEAHRSHFVSLVIRILMPKVRSIKKSASPKESISHRKGHRKAVLAIISQLNVNERSLFFALLMKPLKIISDETTDLFWISGKSSLDYFQKSKISKYINVDALSTLSRNEKSGFLHVIEHILKVFDVFHVRPFLDFLMGCVVRLLTNHDQAGTSLKEFKELRSLCLKIIARFLEKYEDCDLGSEFWDLFFSAMNPSIKSFKQEGSSSEKPSSLFTCFLSMSKSPNLVAFLCREESLVPDIFSILTVPTASEPIKSSALSFIKNLLSLEKDLEEDDHMIKGFLNPYIDALINNLHSLFRGDILRRKFHGKKEIKILKLLSKHIRDESHVMKYLNILLSFLDKRVKDSDIHREALLVIEDITSSLGKESTNKIIDAVSPLLVDAGPDVRLCICDLLESLAKIDFSLDRVAKCVSDMNATSLMEVDDLDYETIMDAYAKIDVNFFNESSEQHMMIILSQSLYNITSKDVTLKDCACNLLCTFIEFSASILCQEASAHSVIGNEVSKSVASWTGDRVLWIMNNFILKHIGDAVNKGISIGKGEILLIRKMVMSLPDSGNLAALRPLCSENDDIDFFKNVFNIQTHRRAKAINRFAKEIKDSNLPEGVVRKLLVSIFFNMLLDGQERKDQDRKGRVKKGQDSKDQNVYDACEEALASLSAHMSWNPYYALLNRCFFEMKKRTLNRCFFEMKKRTDKSKRLLNLVCLILDKFHFAKGGDAQEEIRVFLEKTLFPKILKLMGPESGSVNVNAYVAAVKVVKLLPQEIMDSNIDSLVYKLSNILRNPLESTRADARKALAAYLKDLGLEDYLQLVVRKLTSILTKGSEVHVLGYTVHYILSTCLPSPTGCKLDHCLEDLLDVVKADLLGDVDELKEDKKDSMNKRKKKVETNKRKSLDTLKLIAENVTFSSHALELLSLVTCQLHGPMTSKFKSKLEDMLKSIATGIGGNPSVDQGELFCFIYQRVGNQTSSQPSKKKRKSRHIQDTSGTKPCPHLITVFALNLLHNTLKRIQPNSINEELVSKLDPFVKLLVGCLSSVYEDVVSSSIRCFTALLRLQLPSFKSEAGKVITKVFAIAESAVSSGSPLVQSCLKMLTALVSNDNFKLSPEQLKRLIQFPMFADLESDSSVASLSLLRAIVRKKLVVPKIYDIVDQVSRLMITHQDGSIRNSCGNILVEFLVNYTPSEKCLEGHFNFLRTNLSYEHSTGRESVLEVLQKLIDRFPNPNLDKQSKPSLGHPSVLDRQCLNLFIELACRLEAENDKDLLVKIFDVIKLLIGCMSNYKSSLELSLGWYKQENSRVRAAKVLGLFIEAKKFPEKDFSIVLEEAKTILESAVKLQNTVVEGSIPLWKEAYYSLKMIEKMLKHFPELCFKECFQEDFKIVWTMVFKLLLHRHEWLQTITCRLLNYYFKKLAKSPKPDSLLGKPSSLFMVAASLCFQLSLKLDRNIVVNKNNDATTEGEKKNNDVTEEDYLRENLVFAVTGLHSMIGETDDEYWSSLDNDEQAKFLEAFPVFDSWKVRSTFLALATSDNLEVQDDVRNVLVGSLLKRMGKIAFDEDSHHMRIVFNVYKEFASNLNQEECRLYAFRILLPLYKVCQGFTGKVITDELKQLAEEVRDSVRDKSLGVQMFVQVYSEIKKSLEVKREKRSGKRRKWPW